MTFREKFPSSVIGKRVNENFSSFQNRKNNRSPLKRFDQAPKFLLHFQLDTWDLFRLKSNPSHLQPITSRFQFCSVATFFPGIWSVPWNFPFFGLLQCHLFQDSSPRRGSLSKDPENVTELILFEILDSGSGWISKKCLRRCWVFISQKVCFSSKGLLFSHCSMSLYAWRSVFERYPAWENGWSNEDWDFMPWFIGFRAYL